MKLNIDIPEELQKPHYVLPLWQRIGATCLLLLVWGFLGILIYQDSTDTTSIISILLAAIGITWLLSNSFKKQQITNEFFSDFSSKCQPTQWDDISRVDYVYEKNDVLELILKLKNGQKKTITGWTPKSKKFINLLEIELRELTDEVVFDKAPIFDDCTWPFAIKAIGQGLSLLIYLSMIVTIFSPIVTKTYPSWLLLVILIACIIIMGDIFDKTVSGNHHCIQLPSRLVDSYYKWHEITSLSDIREIKKRFFTWYEMDIETRDGIKTIRTANRDTYPKLMQVKEIFEKWQREQS